MRIGNIDFRGPRLDFIAGITLGIENISDAMASGLLAGVVPIHNPQEPHS
jgi:hypothetical protein